MDDIGEATGAKITLTAVSPASETARPKILKLAGLIPFAAGLALELGPRLELAVFLASYLMIGGEVLRRAAGNIARGRIFDENFLMSLATIGAFALGEYPEGAAVMLFYQVGAAFEDFATDRSRRSIAALTDLRPDFANVKIGGEERRVSPEEVRVGDLIVVRPGEKIPLDGVVTEGRSALDVSSLTGESLPREVEPGREVLSGSINLNGLITVEAKKTFGESAVSQILDLMRRAVEAKAPAEKFITKFARYYTPAVVGAAAALAVFPPLVLGGGWTDWLYRALAFLVVSCPCALVISIPLSFFGGLGGAARAGILIKGARYLDALHDVDTIAFDKTGTLTKGAFEVTEIIPAPGFTAEETLELAAGAEFGSNHPIARSIMRAYGRPVRAAEHYEEIAGLGVRAATGGRTILAGAARLLRGLELEKSETAGTVVYIAVDGVFAGRIVIADELKPDSRTAIEELKKLGVRRMALLTGDSRPVAEKIGRELGLEDIFAELLPQDKLERLEKLFAEKSGPGRLLFVGDGVNDAPVLARADIGLAMGGLGSDAALEAADAALMTDEPSKIATAIRISRKTRRIVLQNIVLALSVKGVILALAALGEATMWAAVFGDVGVAVIAILNAMRAMGRQNSL